MAFGRVGLCCEEVKPFGPVHAYVALATVGVDSEIVPPAQYGPLLEGTGAAGGALTTTVVSPAAEVQPLNTVTEYVPASASVAFARVGFCSDDVKPFGPVHAYVAPGTAAVDSEIVPPAQYGPPFAGTGVAALVLTTTFVLPASEVQPLVVTMTEYVPASAAAALARVGFWSVEVKPFGPVHAYVALATSGVESEIVSLAQ